MRWRGGGEAVWAREALFQSLVGGVRRRAVGQCPVVGSPESARCVGLCSRSRIPWEGSRPHRVRGRTSVEVTPVGGGDTTGRARKGLFDTFSGQSLQMQVTDHI